MDIRHDIAGSRFVAVKDDSSEAGRIVYDVEVGGNLSALSVYVQPEMQGQGIAAKLLEGLVCHARKHGLKIIPICPYVAKEFANKPDIFADVAAKPPEKPDKI